MVIPEGYLRVTDAPSVTEGRLPDPGLAGVGRVCLDSAPLPTPPYVASWSRSVDELAHRSAQGHAGGQWDTQETEGRACLRELVGPWESSEK